MEGFCGSQLLSSPKTPALWGSIESRTQYPSIYDYGHPELPSHMSGSKEEPFAVLGNREAHFIGIKSSDAYDKYIQGANSEADEMDELSTLPVLLFSSAEGSEVRMGSPCILPPLNGILSQSYFVIPRASLQHPPRTPGTTMTPWPPRSRPRVLR